MVIVFDKDGFYMALAEGIDPIEYASSIGGTAVTMKGEPPSDLHEPLIDGNWHIPPETIYANALYAENQWREEQMPIARNTVTAIDFGEEGIAGTIEEWKAYWLALRKWTVNNPDFPDQSKRPIAPQ